MNNIIYISFYTEGYYENVMNSHLLPSLLLFNLPYYILPMENKHNWHENTKQKISFILKALKENYPIPLVWIDADGKIEDYPKLFYEIPKEYDIGVHTLDWKEQYGKEGSELLSGTVFLRNNEKTEQLVELWAKYADESSGWEQRALEKAIKDLKIKVYELPRTYCYITTIPSGKPPKVIIDNPIISHWQVSRKVKKNKELLK
ncbi:hypothetical protein LCGC14_2192630 [marine sediment metagenome]|uniref:Nucleotide-diphospho-sugar transferase domain-containing protein n=1 Tax=marine sediment metagenome TaxID=412755 RepID=A0A0F9E667_9ZZZZ